MRAHGDETFRDRMFREVGLDPDKYLHGSGEGAPPDLISAAEIMEMDLPDPEWVIEDVLPVGVTLLVGKPKKGKSWMGLGMCVDVAAGGKAFGVKDVRRGEALYLALEDHHKRLKSRLTKALNGEPAPEGLHLGVKWPRMDQGGTERLEAYLKDNPRTSLVVIDTLAKIRKPAHGHHVYSEDYAALEPLLPLAQEHGVAIVVVYHLCKAAAADPLDEISSSTGLTAGVDSFLILRRTPGSKGPTLYVDGRDIEEPTEYALTWNQNTTTWTIEGEAEELHISKERADILLALNRAGQYMTPKQVTDALGPHAKYGNVKYLMWTMLGDGQLVKNDKGAYYPPNPTNPTNPTPDPSEGLAADPEPTNLTLPHRNGDNGDSVSGVSGDSALDKRDVDSVGGVSAQEPTDDWRSHQLACECAECLAPMPSGYARARRGA